MRFGVIFIRFANVRFSKNVKNSKKYPQVIAKKTDRGKNFLIIEYFNLKMLKNDKNLSPSLHRWPTQVRDYPLVTKSLRGRNNTDPKP